MTLPDSISPFIVNVVLADRGQTDSNGKIGLLGAGWSAVAVGPNGDIPTQVVAVFVEAPWNECNKLVQVSMALMNADGRFVQVPGSPEPANSDGSGPLRFNQEITFSPPEGAPPATAGTASFMIELMGGLPVGPGTYRWVVEIDGKSNPSWSTGFSVIQPPSVFRSNPNRGTGPTAF